MVRVEVGTGVGEDFVPLDYEDDGVTFELRELVERGFFVGNTGAGPREVWNPERFAKLARKLFHDGSGRFDLGFFDITGAGFNPPQSVSESDEQAQSIFSGSTLNADTGIYGSITQNYFSMADSQAMGTLTPGTFGYFLPGELSPFQIGRYDTGDPLGESDATVAWWDGSDWRYGIDGDFAVVPEDQLEQWAALLLGLDIDAAVPERYQSALADDMSAMNMDVYLKIEDMILGEDGQPRYDSVTLRMTAVSVDSLNIDGEVGTDVPLWAQEGNEAPALATYLPDTGVPVALNDFADTLRNEAVEIEVLANDLLDGAAVPNTGDTTVVIGDQPPNGTVTVDEGTNVVTYDPDAAYTGPDSFTYTVVYNDGGDDQTSNVATVTISVIEPPDPTIPVAANDSASTIEVEPVTIDVLANDTLAEAPIMNGPDVEVAVLDAPVVGTAVVNDDNTITYTANADSSFTIVERFTYTVTVDGAQSNAALVTVRAESKEFFQGTPIANDDTAETTGTEPVTVDVLDNDTYDGLEIPESATVEIVDQPGNGEAVVDSGRTITYTAEEGFEGEDTLTYTVTVDGVVSDAATVSVTVNAPDDDPTGDDPTGDGAEDSDGCGCASASNSGAPFGAFLFALSLVALRIRYRRSRR